MPRLPQFWNTTAEEESRRYRAEEFASPGSHRLIRAVSVDADSVTAFRWVCQLRVAPYSYDWLDNRGRHSPRLLTPDVDRLEVGQSFCEIFRIVAVEPGQEVTAVMQPGPTKLFGDVVVTYQVNEIDEGRSRLVCCLAVAATSLPGRIRRYLLGWGDLVMMRKQLLTLKACAESTARAAG